MQTSKIFNFPQILKKDTFNLLVQKSFFSYKYIKNSVKISYKLLLCDHEPIFSHTKLLNTNRQFVGSKIFCLYMYKKLYQQSYIDYYYMKIHDKFINLLIDNNPFSIKTN